MNEPNHELNQLTEKLFANGWTREHYPDYVKPYNWFYGGFQYTVSHLRETVYETGCGLHVSGEYWVSGDMTYMGVTWSPENDNPTVNCPFRRIGCPLNHTLLRNAASTQGATTLYVPCACHQIFVSFDYEKSLDKAYQDKEQHEEILFQEFALRKKGRVCRQMCHYNEREGKWYQYFDPIYVCARSRCRYCEILKKELSLKRGNVFYDLRITTKIRAKGLFPEEYVTHIEKGKRLLDENVSLDICSIIARTQTREIHGKERMRHHRELYFSEHHDIFFEMEVENIRAESRESRDLLKDLADIQSGYTVSHASDQKKLVQENKRKDNKKRLERKVRQLQKKVLASGIDELDQQGQRMLAKLRKNNVLSQDVLDSWDKQKKDEQIIKQISFY